MTTSQLLKHKLCLKLVRSLPNSIFNWKKVFLDNATRFHPNIFDQIDLTVTQILLFGEPSLSDKVNTNLLNLTIDYIISTKRLEEQLLIDNWYGTFLKLFFFVFTLTIFLFTFVYYVYKFIPCKPNFCVPGDYDFLFKDGTYLSLLQKRKFDQISYKRGRDEGTWSTNETVWRLVEDGKYLKTKAY